MCSARRRAPLASHQIEARRRGRCAEVGDRLRSTSARSPAESLRPGSSGCAVPCGRRAADARALRESLYLFGSPGRLSTSARQPIEPRESSRRRRPSRGERMQCLSAGGPEDGDQRGDAECAPIWRERSSRSSRSRTGTGTSDAAELSWGRRARRRRRDRHPAASARGSRTQLQGAREVGDATRPDQSAARRRCGGRTDRPGGCRSGDGDRDYRPGREASPR